MSTIDLTNVHEYTGGVALTVGGVLDVGLLPYGPELGTATFVDDDDAFEVADTATFNGAGFSYIGQGTAATLALGGIELDSKPVVAFSQGGTTYLWYPEGEPLAGVLSSTINLTSDTPYAYCFAEGTLIDTAQGERKVEDLAIGDTIHTANGSETTIKWVGVQTLSSLFSETGKQMVRISAGALGDGLPHSDLTVTADHGMILDGLVVNASALVNGSTIDFVPATELGGRFKVYHVETESHEEILANGAAAETFVDYAARKNFDNYEEYLALYSGVERLIPEMTKPRISSSRMLPTQLRTKLGLTTPVIQFRKSA